MAEQGKLREWAREHFDKPDQGACFCTECLARAGESLIRSCAEIARQANRHTKHGAGCTGCAKEESGDAILRAYGLVEVKRG